MVLFNQSRSNLIRVAFLGMFLIIGNGLLCPADRVASWAYAGEPARLQFKADSARALQWFNMTHNSAYPRKYTSTCRS